MARRHSATPHIIAGLVAAVAGTYLLSAVILGLVRVYLPLPNLYVSVDLYWFIIAAAGGALLALAIQIFARAARARPSTQAVILAAASAARPFVAALVATGLIAHIIGPGIALRSLAIATVAMAVAASVRPRRGGALMFCATVVAGAWLFRHAVTLYRWDTLTREELAALEVWIAFSLYPPLRAAHERGLLRRASVALAWTALAAGAIAAGFAYANAGAASAAFVAATAVLAALLLDRSRVRQPVYPALLAILVGASALTAPGRPENRLNVGLALPAGTLSIYDLSLNFFPEDPSPVGCGAVDILVGVDLPDTQDELKKNSTWQREWPKLVNARWSIHFDSMRGAPDIALNQDEYYRNRNDEHHVVAHRYHSRFGQGTLEVSGRGGLATPDGDHRPNLTVAFTSHWATAGELGACYLTVPSLSEIWAISGHDPPPGLREHVYAMRASLSVPQHSDLVMERTFPTPVAISNGEQPSSWTCGVEGRSPTCRAVAVIKTHWSASYLQVALLLAGAFFSLAAESWLRGGDERPGKKAP